VVQRLGETAAEPYLLHGKQLNCKASIGVAMFPTHGIELWELIDRADNSMYRAKQESRSKDQSSPSAGETIVV